MNAMNQESERGVFFSEIHRRRHIGTAFLAVLVLLGAFLAVKTLAELKNYRYIGGGVPVSNTITVSGKGEVFAVPDIATFSFSVVEEKKTAAEAQKAATDKINKAIIYLKGKGVGEKDIKTLGYNVYPKYEYQQMRPEICPQYGCPPGKQVLTGFEVNQTISVKARDTKIAGELLAGIGELNVQNISGLDFTIDDEEKLMAEARKVAIADAKNKAEELADDLEVRLVRIVNFSESGAPYPMYYGKGLEADGRGGVATSMPPEVPVGENKIISNIAITYEIR